MSLTSAIEAGVNAAIEAVKDLMVEVPWTFVSAGMGDYDPLTDTTSVSSTTDNILVLLYEDKGQDDKIAFSSQGNFIETPTNYESIKVLMSKKYANGRVPSVRDYFMDGSEKWSVSHVERIPGDSVYLMRAARI